MKTILLSTLLFTAISGHSQTIREAAFITMYDSNGNQTFIKKSDYKSLNKPFPPHKKIYRYSYLIDTVGYYDCDKKKYVSLPPKK